MHWYSTSYEDQLSSDPLCLDDAKFLLTRNCTEAGWVPSTAPDCLHKQNIRSVHDNFARFSGYDLFVIGENAAVYRSRKKQWSKDCLKFGFTKDIMEYKKYFLMHPDYFWLPIRRNKAYFPHVWSNLGEKFGLVTEEYMDHGNEDCLAVNFSSNHIKSIPCTEYYSELCLYVYVSPLLPLSCPKGFFTTRFQRDDPKCFQVAKQECATYFRYKEPYDKILYNSLMEEFETDGDCRIEVDPFPPHMSFNMDYWMTHLDNVSYVNWSPLVNRDYNPQLPTYTYADAVGDWLLGSNYKCTVCEQRLVSQEPSLFLRYDYEEVRLELLVSNPEFMWTEEPGEPHIACFTTATYALLANVKVKDLVYTLEYRHSGLVINISAFEVQLNDDGPGEYWCEAVTHPRFEVISSNRHVVFHTRKGVVFAIRVTHKCTALCMGVYANSVLEGLSSEFEKFLKLLDLDLDIEDVRVMDVLNSTSTRETLLFHVTFSTENLPEELEQLNFDSDGDAEFLLSVNLINYVQQKLEPHHINKWDDDFIILGFNHTLFCVSEMAVNGQHKLIWGRMNEITVVNSLCLDENYVLTYAQCVGEFPYGVEWNSAIPAKCESDREAPKLTQNLFALVSSPKVTVQEVKSLGVVTQDELYELNPADLFLYGSLIRRFANNVTEMLSAPGDLDVFAQIFSKSLEVTQDRAQISARHMNATNLILDNFERLLQRSSLELSLLQTPEQRETGVVQFTHRNTICFIIDPSVRNITGIAFYLKKASEQQFQDGRIEYLDWKRNTTELLEDADLEGAALLPMELLEQIRVNFTGQLRLVLTISGNDILFRGRDSNQSEYTPAGRVITVSIPNYERPLPDLLPIIFRPRRDFAAGDSIQCGFWNFHPSNSTRISEWSSMGCDYLARSSRDEDPAYMCGCQHFTNFAFLMTGNNNKGPTDPNGTVLPPDESLVQLLISLDVITNVGCILSLIGVILIWLTALVFRSWREREGTKVLLQLSFGIGLQMIAMLMITSGAVLHNSAASCITMGIVLHYSVLVIFAWMLITAYLQYLRYVVVFGNLLPKHFFLKANIVGWLLPFLPILIICIIDPGLYVPTNAPPLDDWKEVLCYPQGNALYIAVVLPVTLVILANLCIFGLVIYNITMGLQKCNNHRKNSSKIHRAQLRLTILLFFLLGLTWIFGLLVHINYDSLVFQYLFTIFGTLQGFVLFVYFIILDPQTRKLWLSRFSCCYKKEVTSSTYNS